MTLFISTYIKVVAPIAMNGSMVHLLSTLPW